MLENCLVSNIKIKFLKNMLLLKLVACLVQFVYMYNIMSTCILNDAGMAKLPRLTFARFYL